MESTAKKIKYPQNLQLKDLVTESGKSITWLAKKIGVSRVVLSNTVNGNYKGSAIVTALKVELGITDNLSTDSTK